MCSGSRRITSRSGRGMREEKRVGEDRRGMWKIMKNRGGSWQRSYLPPLDTEGVEAATTIRLNSEDPET
jgi:hypothetical protein